MIQAYGLYVASTVGAVALFLMMPRQGYNPRPFGALIGAAAIGGLWLWLGGPLMELESIGLSGGALPYYYIFSGMAIFAGTRVITHTQPVYSALWFVMVVLSSSGLFLILGAEFVAFGMVIIYGGAILVTYMFVIMLASQSSESENRGDAGDTTDESSPDETANAATEYDRVARQPAGAVIAGFLLLALLLDVSFRPMSPNPDAIGPTATELIEGKKATDDQPAIKAILTNRTQKRLLENADEAERAAMEATGISNQHVDNVERIGIDLFRGHPLGLELAGVILLISLVGAVVIARQRSQIDPESPQANDQSNT